MQAKVLSDDQVAPIILFAAHLSDDACWQRCGMFEALWTGGREGQKRPSRCRQVTCRFRSTLLHIWKLRPRHPRAQHLHNLLKMPEQPQNLRALYESAERARQELASSYETNSPIFKENLSKTIATYEECLKVSEQISLFSPNETLEDISSSDLQYV